MILKKIVGLGFLIVGLLLKLKDRKSFEDREKKKDGMTLIERKRMEQDGLFLESPDHWEMFETTIYIYKSKEKRQHKNRGEHTHSQGRVLNVPIQIARHLNLKNKDKIMVAIKRSE